LATCTSIQRSSFHHSSGVRGGSCKLLRLGWRQLLLHISSVGPCCRAWCRYDIALARDLPHLDLWIIWSMHVGSWIGIPLRAFYAALRNGSMVFEGTRIVLLLVLAIKWINFRSDTIKKHIRCTKQQSLDIVLERLWCSSFLAAVPLFGSWPFSQIIRYSTHGISLLIGILPTFHRMLARRSASPFILKIKDLSKLCQTAHEFLILPNLTYKSLMFYFN